MNANITELVQLIEELKEDMKQKDETITRLRTIIKQLDSVIERKNEELDAEFKDNKELNGYKDHVRFQEDQISKHKEIIGIRNKRIKQLEGCVTNLLDARQDGPQTNLEI